MTWSLRRSVAPKAAPPWSSEDTICEEVFGRERLEEHAESLARAQHLGAAPNSVVSLHDRLAQNEQVLLAAHRIVSKAVAEGRSITPAAEWLINNSHVVEEQMRDVRKNLPPEYYEQLPKLSGGHLAGYPRILGLAWAYVAHTDSRFDYPLLISFVEAYQRVEPLRIGELWALPITLRIVLVENLRRSASRIVASRAERKSADLFVDQLLKDPAIAASGLQTTSLVDAEGRPRTAYIVQLSHRFSDGIGEFADARDMLSRELGELNLSMDEIIRREHQSIAATNNTVRHIIRSMRVIPDVNWALCFERLSCVDAELNRHPGFARMDFSTRNSYRDVIELLARRSPSSERDIARLAVELASQQPEGQKASEPGYYLFGVGRRRLLRKIDYRRKPRDAVATLTQKGGLPGYQLSIAVLTGAILSVPALALAGQAISPATIALLGVAALLPALELAIAMINQAITHELVPRIVPGLELKDGVPDEARTLVAIPALLTDIASIDELVHRLEIHHLATQQKNMFYTLLTDWVDADTSIADRDVDLLDHARRAIGSLNRQYAGDWDDDPRFYILHRRRRWNAAQSCWMGWERKRGKLCELNRLLRGAADTTFIADRGVAVVFPKSIKYVITLDSDTRLPRDAARRMIGKMLHPLNQPEFETGSGRIVEGYGLLQPRVTPKLAAEHDASVYQKLFSAGGGVDPYAGAISDVYQDMFGEGSFAGKGIYDVDAFETATEGRFAENTILSHDLLEGLYARAGLATDVEVIEEFPSRYDVARSREHRWVRGDWQLLPWIFKKAEFPTLGRWKLIDNLRRSLTPISAVVALVISWHLPLAAALIVSAFIGLSIVVPAFLSIVVNLTGKDAASTAASHFGSLATDAKLAAAQSVLHLTFLADKAYYMSDAILRTLYRVCISRRNLLEWTTAAQAKAMAAASTAAYYKRMSGGVVLAAIALAYFVINNPQTLLIAGPVTALWLIAPAIAKWVSFRPASEQREILAPANRVKLRVIGRQTWQFFEDLVTAEDHFLPPDNLQEEPQRVLAHRTSPTNIGLYLLSTVSAHAFGWISILEAAERIEQTMRTLGELPRHKGHFYNWYDTRARTVLEPRYVSTVDSGNLAGHLIAVGSACRDWATAIVDNPAAKDGIVDGLEIVSAALPIERRSLAIDRAVAKLQKSIERPPQGEVALDWPLILTHASNLADLISHDAASPAAYRGAQCIVRTASSHAHQAEHSKFGIRALRRRLVAIADAAEYMAAAMDFTFLIDPERELLSIGYSVDEGRLDQSCYDLLASEARLASLIAIAKGDLPSRHWFRLGRTLLPVSGKPVLISWSGSMFEYLMPDLVTMTPPHSLLGNTAHVVVEEQIRFGDKAQVPWGVSESAYNARDLEFTYQYSSFGVPELGLKRGLGDSLVIAPYATALASMVAPNSAARNFAALKEAGACGRYGFYEAIDYTPTHVAPGERFEIIKAYMAHHQGMSIVALANTVLDSTIARRFHASPMVQSAELLLQERAPRLVPKPIQRATLVRLGEDDDDAGMAVVRRMPVRGSRTPNCHFLANDALCVMTTSTGAGFTKWNGIAITRWHADATLDNLGSFVYLRDTQTGSMWSAGYQPAGLEAKSSEAAFSEDRVQLSRVDGTLRTVLDIIVSPEDSATCRRVSVTNLGRKPRTIDVTSYEELALASLEADAAHPAFSKLFVETHYDERAGAVIATRRRRSPHEPEIYVATFATADAGEPASFEYETDRAKFIGRGRSLVAPIAVINGRPFEGSTGAVLDPVFAIRQRVTIAPGATVRVAFWTLVCSNPDTLAPLVEKYQDAGAFARTATLAWTHGLVERRHLGIDADDAMLFQQIAGALVYASPALRASERTLRGGAHGASALWAAGVSGDLPVVLVRIDEIDDIALVRQLLHAYEYWRRKCIEIDLVILNDHTASYQQELQSALEALCHSVSSRHRLSKDNSKGSVFLLRSDLLDARTLAALPAIARGVFHARRGALAEQITRLTEEVAAPAPPSPRAAPPEVALTRADTSDLEFFNGFGGFRRDGREYVTVLEAGQTTPAPWINVVANDKFGFHVSADGGGYTWCVNSRERQLTPWSNDPVINRPGEVLYVRDEETGELWGPAATPLRDHAAPYIVAHGQGYTRLEHTSRGIELVLEQFVAGDDPVKFSRLTLRNKSGKQRRLSVTSYTEWVLGSSRRATAANLATDFDQRTGAITARNPWHPFFPDRVAFSCLQGSVTAWTADRADFIGISGRIDNPAALAKGGRMRGVSGVGHDPCAVLQTQLVLEASSETEVVHLLGDAANKDEALGLVEKYAGVDAGGALGDAAARWEKFHDKIQISTPDRALDVLMNRWLPYQTLSCRLWGRAGFYQAGGAFGFRDQLQDTMSLAMTRPDLARAHILTAAGRQFPEGDVQHWWLSPSGHGVRTRIADSCLWLAYTTAHYVKTTGDEAVLDEDVGFIDGPQLKPHEHEVYFLAEDSHLSAPLYEHCARTIDRSMQAGAHGLTLFGGGDWNDGMNRVGIEGRGESVWLSWFVIACIKAMLPYAEARGDRERADRWIAHMGLLQSALETHGWDGQWYRRGYYDDGTPLGSAMSDECQIDSVSQSWSVLSGAGDAERSRISLAAVKEHLIDSEDGLALLFKPPFDQTKMDPGYIKGYPPGIRENGGQYTHAAAWCVIALAQSGDGDGAGELLSIINPINLSATRAGSRRYRVEPYVVAADVYSTGTNRGRGGWSWYTGAAGWIYRATLEYVLGVRKEGDTLVIEPSIPRHWPQFEVSYTHNDTIYRIKVRNPSRVSRGIRTATLNGAALQTTGKEVLRVPLTSSGKVQEINIIMGISGSAVAAA